MHTVGTEKAWGYPEEGLAFLITGPSMLNITSSEAPTPTPTWGNPVGYSPSLPSAQVPLASPVGEAVGISARAEGLVLQEGAQGPSLPSLEASIDQTWAWWTAASRPHQIGITHRFPSRTFLSRCPRATLWSEERLRGKHLAVISAH